MVQAQGVHPSDPYLILQLDPHAPHELVVEAYWSLVRRVRRGDSSDIDAVRRSEEIGAAYAVLADPARRRALDAALGIDAQSPSKSRTSDYYEVLCIDPEADAKIIEVAYQLLSRDEDQKKRSVRRFMLDEAYRALSNPPVRAQYDAKRTPAARHGVTLVESRDVPRRAPRVPSQRRRGFLGLRRHDDAAPDVRDSRLLTLRESAVRWDVAQGDGLRVQLAGAGIEAELVMMGGPHAGRRLALGEHPVSMGGTLRDHVLLDPGLPPEAILVWHHGERSMLKHMIGAGVTVNGAPPALSIIVLEDGDAITVGAHEMRYHRIG
jgi:curved DNA-binding protein CbpA